MEQGGYTPKELHFEKEGQAKLIKGIGKMADAVKSTLGPMGNTVLIESPDHTHGITVTKDGVTVAKSIALVDPVENLAVRMMREAADKTATLAGDGTTTAIVLTETLVKTGLGIIKAGDNKTEILRELLSETKEVIKELGKMSKPVNKKMLGDVASISANNDSNIGRIIASTYNSVGKNGIVTVEKSQTSDTYNEVTDGLKIERGYSSNLFVNNHKKDECILDDVHILVSDAEISNLLTIENVLKPIIQDGKKLLIVAPCSNNVINTLAANVMKNSLKICTITPPSFGYKQHELMQDIALTVGATYFSEKTGDDLSIISFSDLGHATRVIVDKDSTIVLKDKENNNEEVEQRVEQLWEAHKLANKKPDKDFILSRIASLTGGIGVIYVGGNTDLEQKELFDRVDDAVCAVRSALLEGILPGGGLALYSFYQRIKEKQVNEKNKSKKIAYAILADALRAPLVQILDNAGLEENKIYPEDDIVLGYNGYDVKAGVYGDMIKMGIIDPMKVTKTALQNAVSVAITILSTNAIVTMARSYESKNG
jgi:chaperonin GroEL|tara:strand:- start:589 stop:2211 length:1623 start_codon:yes stop_codon:yes gene_type:complete